VPLRVRGTPILAAWTNRWQINIWSCRVLHADVEEGLRRAGLKAAVYQLRIEEIQLTDELCEVVTLVVEDDGSTLPDAKVLAREIHNACPDVSHTYPATFLVQRIRVERVTEGAIPRVARTGKVRPLIDRRSL